MAGINFRSYPNITKITIGNNTVCSQNFQNAFGNMANMSTCTFPTSNINNMYSTFYNCMNYTVVLIQPIWLIRIIIVIILQGLQYVAIMLLICIKHIHLA